MFSSWDYAEINTSLKNIAPNGEHLFGTDSLWTRSMDSTYGMVQEFLYSLPLRQSIIDVVIGVTYGLISGYFGGKVDSIMQRIQEVINSIPTLVVLTILLMFMKPSLVYNYYCPCLYRMDWYVTHHTCSGLKSKRRRICPCITYIRR